MSLHKCSLHRSIPEDIKFGGNSSENVSIFLSRLVALASFMLYSCADLCKLFPLTVTGKAFFWFQSLNQEIKDDWTKLHNACLDQIRPTSRSIIQELLLPDAIHKPGESVEEYLKSLIQ